MKNPFVYYAVMAVGVIGLALGLYWRVIKNDHPLRGEIILAVGVVLLIAGIVGFFVMKPKAAAS
jgi:FtsH-binding integral membrane protein